MPQCRIGLVAIASAHLNPPSIATTLFTLLLCGFAVAVTFALRILDLQDRIEPILPTAVPSHHEPTLSHAPINDGESGHIYFPFPRILILRWQIADSEQHRCKNSSSMARLDTSTISASTLLQQVRRYLIFSIHPKHGTIGADVQSV